MSGKEDWLKARLRKRDKDIKDELERRNLERGELADIIREGVRWVLFEKDKHRNIIYVEPNKSYNVNEAKDIDVVFDDIVTQKRPDPKDGVESLFKGLVDF